MLEQHAHLCQEGIWSEAGCQLRRACCHLQNGSSQDFRLGHHLQCPPADAAACCTSDSSPLAIRCFSDSKHSNLCPLRIRMLCACCWPLSLLRLNSSNNGHAGWIEHFSAATIAWQQAQEQHHVVSVCTLLQEMLIQTRIQHTALAQLQINRMNDCDDLYLSEQRAR